MIKKFKKIYCLKNEYIKNTTKLDSLIFVGKNRDYYFSTKVHPKCEMIKDIVLTREYDAYRFIDRSSDDKEWLYLQYEKVFAINYVPTKNYPNFVWFRELKYWFTKKEKNFIKKIKIDTSKFAYKNEIYKGTIDKIVHGFDIDFRDPILINKDWFLLDWQHRLAACKMLWIDFIDALVQNND